MTITLFKLDIPALETPDNALQLLQRPLEAELLDIDVAFPPVPSLFLSLSRGHTAAAASIIVFSAGTGQMPTSGRFSNHPSVS